MKILEEPIEKGELAQAEHIVEEDFVKGVVDVEKQILAIDAELHADIEQELLRRGSNQYDLWGINLYLDEDGDDFVEFDSMINVRPAQGNRSRGVDDEKAQQRIREVVRKWVK